MCGIIFKINSSISILLLFFTTKGRIIMLNKSSFTDKKNIPYVSRIELAICVALACVNIVLFALLSILVSSVHPAVYAFAFTALYLIEVALVGIHRASDATMANNADIHELLMENGSIVLKNSLSPIIALDGNGCILWYNEAMREVIPYDDNVINENIDDLIGDDIKDNLFSSEPVKIGNGVYKTEGFTVSQENGGLYIIMLTDITDLRNVEKRYADERVAVAYIAIDNVEESLQYVREEYRNAVAVVDSKIKAWAESVDAVLKPYDNDKYIMLFDSKYLDGFIADRFAILDTIRDTRIDDSMSVTVSIGVSRMSGTLAQREAAAKEAIDMALQRGGDQAVYRMENSIEYYGGRTKSVYKRSNVRSRTFVAQLASLIARSDNVIVMGHRYGDFDSFGASVGIARLCMLCGAKTNVAVDMRDKNLEPCIRMLQGTDTYEQIFVDNAEGLELVGPDTLVILVDHNTLERSQFANISNKVDKIAVIDHHRTTDALHPSIKLSYIEPSASSACELVGEMLENAISSRYLSKEVADMLLAGVLLDTKQFTRNTGTRTFGVAQYLRGAGASPHDVNNLFKAAPADLSKEARFHTAITTYHGNIAISSCDGDTDESYRIVASKAADKMLSLRGIDAAFALVKIGEQVHISGRSNGTINVQLILEKLNGGGHFDVAGAQVTSDSVESVLISLKDSIDNYLEM